jgi:adenylosuccinate synthase
MAPRWITRVIGVAKAYTTRVGRGPMPTELLDETGETIRQAGAEFGTVTGRPRRCGWFDAELVRFTAQLNGCTEIALTKLDVLDSLPRLKVGVGYCPRDGDRSQYWEGDARWLEECQPEYIELEGWQQPTTGIREWAKLPRLAQAYVRRVEELIETPIRFVSVGPGREETISVPVL